jgi:hypothetical protein
MKGPNTNNGTALKTTSPKADGFQQDGSFSTAYRRRRTPTERNIIYPLMTRDLDGSTVDPSGTFFNTVAPTPTITRRPIPTPCRTAACGPIKQFSPTFTPPAMNAEGATVTFSPTIESWPIWQVLFNTQYSPIIASVLTMTPCPTNEPAPNATPDPKRAYGETTEIGLTPIARRLAMALLRRINDRLSIAPKAMNTPSKSNEDSRSTPPR